MTGEDNGLLLLTGGARSGKSRLAAELASRWDGPVTFIATASAEDEDMRSRIARHREARPSGWTTTEEPLDVVGALRAAAPAACVVLDCVTLWVSNLMMHDCDDAAIRDAATVAAGVAASRSSPTIVVTNEVGAGIVPAVEIARRYRDVLGNVNQTWAAAAGRVYLTVAGCAIRLEPLQAPW